MAEFTAAAFFLLFLFCVLGVFSPHFQENWLQHFGLIGMGVTSMSGVYRVFQMAWVPPEMMLFTVGACLFAVGTAMKVWKHRGDRKYKKNDLHKPARNKA